MLVSMEEVSELTRRLRVSFPKSDFESEVEKRIQELAKKIAVNGFRPGKVPPSFIRQRPELYDPIWHEVVQTKLPTHLALVLQEAKLDERLNGPPVIENFPKLPFPDPIAFTVTVHILPNNPGIDWKEIELEKVNFAFEEPEINRRIEKLKRMLAVSNPVNRIAQIGDMVTVQIDAYKNSEKIATGQPETQRFILGEFIGFPPEFEENIVGLMPEETRAFTIEYDENAPNQNFASHAIQFQVTLKTVEEIIPLTDEELLQKAEVTGGMEVLRDEVKKLILDEMEHVINVINKQAVFNKMLALSPTFELPADLVAAEQKYLHQLNDPSVNNPIALNEKSRERVRLGLLVKEMCQRFQITLNVERVKELAIKMAETLPPTLVSPQLFSKESPVLKQIEATVFEEQVMEKILTLAKVTETILPMQVLRQKAVELGLPVVV